MLNEETLLKIAEFVSNDLLWLYFILMIVAFYLLIALFTRSFKRPLNFLGIPTVIVGLLFILIFLIIRVIPISLSEVMINIVLSAAKPVLNIGIICLVIGILMLVLYRVIGAIAKNKSTETMTTSKTTLEEKKEEKQDAQEDETKIDTD